MFLIEDGRNEFYQWDSDRRLIIEDGTITQVHFCNRTDNCSLVVEVYVEGDKFYADVPNILLQTSWDIRVYAVNSNYTKFCKTYNVIARTKPVDYVYTETEVLNYDKLEAQINAVKEGIGVEVEAYMKENPVEVDLTGYATEKYVQEQIANIDIPEGEIVDEVYVGATPPNDTNVKLWVNPDDTLDIATTGYVDEAISKIDIPETDLSNYYTKQETNTAIAQAKPDLSGYALKTEIPDTTGLATEKYVDDAIANIDIPEGDGSSKTILRFNGSGTVDASYFAGINADNALEYFNNCEVYINKILVTEMDYNSGHNNNTQQDRIYLTTYNPIYRCAIMYSIYRGTNNFNEASTINQSSIVYTAREDSVKNWHWYDCSGQSTIPVSNIGSTSHIKIAFTNPQDSSSLYTFDISTSNGNNFHEEWQTKYNVFNPLATTGDGLVNMYFLNDGGNLGLYDTGGNNILEFGVYYLVGFYYWQ